MLNRLIKEKIGVFHIIVAIGNIFDIGLWKLERLSAWILALPIQLIPYLYLRKTRHLYARALQKFCEFIDNRHKKIWYGEARQQLIESISREVFYNE